MSAGNGGNGLFGCSGGIFGSSMFDATAGTGGGNTPPGGITTPVGIFGNSTFCATGGGNIPPGGGGGTTPVGIFGSSTAGAFPSGIEDFFISLLTFVFHERVLLRLFLFLLLRVCPFVNNLTIRARETGKSFLSTHCIPLLTT